MARWLLAALASACVAACAAAAPAPAPDPAPAPVAEPAAIPAAEPAAEPAVDPDPGAEAGAPLLADGEACTAAGECQSGVCEGEGCDQGTCAPSHRACTRDLRPYCGCDGQTFRTSGSCPGRLYAHRGECQ